MRRRWLILIAVLLALGAGSYAATKLIQQSTVEAPAVCPGFRLLQSYLELTPDQRAEVSKIDVEYARVRPVLREKLWDARDDLLRVLKDPKAELVDASAAARRFGSAQQALQQNTIKYTFELRKHLTPAQKGRMHSLMSRGICAASCGYGARRGWGGFGPGGCGLGQGSNGPRRGGR